MVNLLQKKCIVTYSKALDISHVNCEIVPKPTPFIKMYLSQVNLKTLQNDKRKLKNGSIQYAY